MVGPFGAGGEAAVGAACFCAQRAKAARTTSLDGSGSSVSSSSRASGRTCQTTLARAAVSGMAAPSATSRSAGSSAAVTERSHTWR